MTCDSNNGPRFEWSTQTFSPCVLPSFFSHQVFAEQSYRRTGLRSIQKLFKTSNFVSKAYWWSLFLVSKIITDCIIITWTNKIVSLKIRTFAKLNFSSRIFDTALKYFWTITWIRNRCWMLLRWFFVEWVSLCSVMNNLILQWKQIEIL